MVLEKSMTEREELTKIIHEFCGGRKIDAVDASRAIIAKGYRKSISKVDRMLLTMVLVNIARQSTNEEEYTENLAKAIEAGDIYEMLEN